MSAHTNQEEFAAWVESLRDQVSRLSGRRLDGRGPLISAELKGDLLDALDLLLAQAGLAEPDPVVAILEGYSGKIEEALASFEQTFGEQIRESADKSLEALARIEGLNSQLESGQEVLSTQAQLLEQQRLETAEKDAQWQGMMENTLERSEQLQQQLATTIGHLEHSPGTDVVERLNADLESIRQQLEQRQQELNCKEEHLEQVQRELDDSRSLADELEASQHRLDAERQELNEQRKHWQQQQDEWRENRRVLDERISELESQNSDLEFNSHGGSASNEAEVESLKHQIDQLRWELEEARQSSGGSEVSPLADQMESLLRDARQEIEDLRSQNADLATQIAKQQVLNTGTEAQLECDAENLTWEDRKRLIMQEYLTDGSDQESEAEGERRTEIERILATTEQEIARRDREIEDLRAAQEDGSQVDTLEATETMLDADEVIQQERQKLKEIQEEWEQKLRQAEIDLSMERARLARERTELESQRATLENSEEDVSKGKGRTRKWLDHLGLREDLAD